MTFLPCPRCGSDSLPAHAARPSPCPTCGWVAGVALVGGRWRVVSSNSVQAVRVHRRVRG